MGSMRANMPFPHRCCKCGKTFYVRVRINNKKVKLNSDRKHCLKCIPYKHSYSKTISKLGKTLKCSICGTRYTYNRRNTLEKCRRCTRKYLREQNRAEAKLMAIEYKGGKCQKCGYSKCSEAMTFHHVNPNNKQFNISCSWYSQSWDAIKKELDKCTLLCVRCHAEIHAER